ENAEQLGLGRFTKVATFDVATLDAIGKEDGPPEEKVFNLLRGLYKEIDENPAKAVVLQSIREKVDHIIGDLEERKITGLAALDELRALAEEKEEARLAAEESGLSDTAFSVYWVLSRDISVKPAGI